MDVLTAHANVVNNMKRYFSNATILDSYTKICTYEYATHARNLGTSGTTELSRNQE